MTKIIKLDHARKAGKLRNNRQQDCSHKNVTVHISTRTVRCAICGQLLDPFEVLLDMMKGYVPPEDDDEKTKFLREMKKREKKTTS